MWIFSVIGFQCRPYVDIFCNSALFLFSRLTLATHLYGILILSPIKLRVMIEEDNRDQQLMLELLDHSGMTS